MKNRYSDSSYWNSDKSFVEEWEAAIDLFGEVFTGITLIADTGDGLPNFANPDSALTNPPISFKPDCPFQNMDCAAETSILAYFSLATVGGENGKATQESGLNGNLARNRAGNLTSRSVKWLSESTLGGPPQLPGSKMRVSRVIGGLQFGTGFARAPVQEGLVRTLIRAFAIRDQLFTDPTRLTMNGLIPVRTMMARTGRWAESSAIATCSAP